MIKKDCENYSDKLSDENENFTHILESIKKFKFDGVDQTLDLNKFAIDNFQNFNELSFGSFLIIGKREVGKTTMIKNLITNMMSKNIIKNTIIFSSNNKNYDDVVLNNDNIYNELKKQDLKNIINIQNEKNSKSLLLIIDDVMINKKILSSKSFMNIMTNLQSLKITLILTLQFPMAMSSELRNNFNYFCVFNDDYISNMKRLYEYYFGLLPLFSTFNTIMKQLNEYECLMLINNQSKYEINDKLTYYKVNNLPINNFDKIQLILINDNKTEINTNNIELIIELINENNNNIKKLQNKNDHLLQKIDYLNNK
jgi:hypothetical protein